jgi:hypothetical protein
VLTRVRSGAPSRWILAGVLWLASFGLLLLRVAFLNDHFDRISRGRQIAAFGEHPFAGFRDPGYFLTLYASAAAQAISGGGLLGEALMTSAAIAGAAALTFWLAEAASGSRAIAVVAASLTLIVPPRYYDYDKVFFYMAGLAACWHWIDVPSRPRLAAAGVVTAVAGLFRYDNGLYLVAATLVAIVVRRRGSPSQCAADAATYLAAVGLTLTPALIFIHRSASLPEAARQIATYAAREGERSGLFKLPQLAGDLTSVVYVAIVGIVVAAVVLAGVRQRTAGGSLQFAAAKILAAATLLLCVIIFVLREPLGARLGAAVPVAAVIGAWIVGPRRTAIAVLAGTACAAALAYGLTTRGTRVFTAPARLVGRLAAVTSELRQTPVPIAYLPDQGALAGMAAYLRACTPPHARVLVTWFAPEVFFVSGRGFAGGMVVFLGDHWSSEQDQRRTIEQLGAQAVPLAIIQGESSEGFRATFPLVAAYLDAEYRAAGSTSFGDPRVGSDGYHVFIKRDLGDTATDARWRLPCPRGALRVTTGSLP